MVKNKTTHCITLAPDVVKKIEEVGVGKSFSGKIEWMAREFVNERGMLVKYRTAEEFETGNPTMLVETAERVWADSAHLKGFESQFVEYEELKGIISAWLREEGKGVKPGKVPENFIPVLEEAGFKVQFFTDVENDVAEIWVARRERNPDCRECSVVQDINEKLKEIME